LQTSQGYIIRILQLFATKLWNITNFVMLFQAVIKFLSRLVEFKILVNWGMVHYPRIIARINYPCIYQSIIAVVAALFVFYIFYIYLVKYFNLNEKCILLKNSSDRIGLEFFIKIRIGFGLHNFGSDRILNIRQLSDYNSFHHILIDYVYSAI
jgi:hypothetical protein